MRSTWMMLFATVCILSGCASSQTNQMPNQLGYQPPASTSWTEKLTAPITSTFASRDAKKPTPRKSPDELSLEFKSKEPTPSLYVAMAHLSDQGNNADHARTLYQKAIEMDPKNLDAHLGLARMEDRLGNYQAAVQVYQRALSMYPRETRILNDLALCHARHDHMDVALPLLHQAVTLRPDKELYRNNIAKVWIEKNRLDLALTHMEAVYQKPVANYNVAALLVERGRQTDAAPFLAQALQLDPQMSAAQSLMAQISQQPRETGATSGLALSAPQTGVPTLSLHPAGNEHVLPTPEATTGPQMTYPNTGVPSVIPRAQSSSAQTANSMSSQEMIRDFPQVR